MTFLDRFLPGAHRRATATGAAAGAPHSADGALGTAGAPEPGAADVDATLCAEIIEVLAQSSRGNLEPRVLTQGGSPRYANMAVHVNALLDVVDAFVREAGATLEAAADGHHFRAFLTHGLPGTFHTGAQRIDDARLAMGRTAEALRVQDERRARMSAEAAVVATDVSEAAATLARRSGDLTERLGAAVTDAQDALGMAHTLSEASKQIQDAVVLIGSIAQQTRMLALNATIEAARAGESGRGFAVVASEVRQLADETSGSLAAITEHITRAQDAAAAVAGSIEQITESIREIDEHAQEINEASAGSEGLTAKVSELREDLVVIGEVTGARRD